jgi:hypothetical protein
VACTRCGHPGRLPAGRQCARCTLTDQLAVALDDGSGRVNPALLPLLKALTAMDKPRAGLIWLRNPKVVQLLGDLATGRIPLTHQGLHAVTSWRTAAYLRDLLMSCGVLPTIDKQLVHYETWLHRRLAEFADSPHLRLLRQFAGWDQLPRLRATAEAGPSRPATASSPATSSPRPTGSSAGSPSATTPWPRPPRPTWTPGTPPTTTTSGDAYERSCAGRRAPATSPGARCRRCRSAGSRRSPSTAGWSCSASCSPASCSPTRIAPCAPAWPPA